MKYFKQVFILLFITFLAELLAKFLPLPIPASIYGMLILFIALVRGWLSLTDVEDVGEWLIRIMPAMFVVPGAGFLISWPQIKDHLIPWLIIIILSTAVVMIVSGTLSQYLRDKRTHRHHHRAKDEEAMHQHARDYF